jgi:Ca2+/Na+ antiporter
MSLYKDIYKFWYYIKDNVNLNYLIVGLIILFIFIFINITKIIWWGLLLVLLYLLYLSRKTNMNNSIDTKIDKLCSDHPELEMCKVFSESKQNHKKIVETIESKLLPK